MIPAPPGWQAAIERTRNGRTYRIHLPLLAWDEDGAPLTVDHGTGHLVPLPVSGVADIEQNDEEFVKIMPPGGWRIAYRDAENGESSQPLVGWALTANGTVVPLDTDSEGLVGTPDAKNYRIYHPDQDPTGKE